VNPEWCSPFKKPQNYKLPIFIIFGCWCAVQYEFTGQIEIYWWRDLMGPRRSWPATDNKFVTVAILTRFELKICHWHELC